MLEKLQHTILQLRTSDFRFCVIQTQLLLQNLCHIIAGGLMRWLKRPAWKVGDRGFRPSLCHSGFKETKYFFLTHSRGASLTEK